MVRLRSSYLLPIARYRVEDYCEYEHTNAYCNGPGQNEHRADHECISSKSALLVKNVLTDYFGPAPFLAAFGLACAACRRTGFPLNV